MRTRRPTPEHQEAVSRRLALLSAELAGQVVRPDEPVDAPPAPPAPLEAPALLEAPVVPEPGRHASRRPVVPATLRGRVALGPGQLAVVAVLVALGMAVTAWWVVRSGADEVGAPMLAQPAGALATPAVDPVSATSPGASPSAAGGKVTVDVAGKVRRPGIAVLPAGSRVVDALEAAGGARPGVDLSSLNLARLLVDGEQVLVGVPAPVGVLGGGVPAPADASVGPLVNLNTATASELETLPDVGPVTAEAILAWRSEHGGFTAVDELLEVDGIGDATLATIAPHVTV